MKDFDFIVKFASGAGARKSRMPKEEWAACYGDLVIIDYEQGAPFSTHICKPEVVAIDVEFRGQQWHFGDGVAKGQPYMIFLHNKARSTGAYQAPRFGESAHIYAKSVGVILQNDHQIYEMEFHKNGKVIPKMRMYSNVRRMDEQQ